eukprot:COSAG01_NODE_16494_length_1232_cov_1.336275_1_plen_31_part_10
MVQIIISQADSAADGGVIFGATMEVDEDLEV